MLMGEKSSPYQAARVVQYHLKRLSRHLMMMEKQAVQKIVKTLYVNDAVIALRTETETV